MELKIKKIEKPDIDLLMDLANKFNFDNINMSKYENIFEFYDKNVLIRVINYCILPSFTGKHRVYIRNLYYSDDKYIYYIIYSLCVYCKKKSLTINTSLKSNNFNDICKKAFYDNNFTGVREQPTLYGMREQPTSYSNDLIYYIY